MKKQNRQSEKNINWNDLTAPQKRGTAVRKNDEGKWYIDYDMPILTDNREYVSNLVIFQKKFKKNT